MIRLTEHLKALFEAAIKNYILEILTHHNGMERRTHRLREIRQTVWYTLWTILRTDFGCLKSDDLNKALSIGCDQPI